ncbi:MAG: glycerol-3-phosphate acyltransferase [Clostridiales Family XIII bacterium]|nr:glycerol-3-phosphate acyltransferase [Clostridiales Family XIII bacterium]
MNNFFAAALDGAWVPVWAAIAAAVCAYFIGNINPAILLGRAQGIDIRSKGSGNAGATNAARALGKKAGAAVFLIDVAKGWACYFAPHMAFLFVVQRNDAVFRALVSSAYPDAGAAAALYAFSAVPSAVAMLCGLLAVLGHMYPAVFGFRGGKGVATAFGVLLAASPVYALVLLAIVIVFTAIFRRVSLSVLIAVAVSLVLVFSGFAAGIIAWGQFYYNIGVFRFNVFQPLWLSIIMALIVWKHRGNIKRLAKGEESKLSFGGGNK